LLSLSHYLTALLSFDLILILNRLMALLELCELPEFSCDRLVLCIDRTAPQPARDGLTKDLGWIGFGLTTLDEFSQSEELCSDRWLFMDMET
jgi:hypothetical protein